MERFLSFHTVAILLMLLVTVLVVEGRGGGGRGGGGRGGGSSRGRSSGSRSSSWGSSSGRSDTSWGSSSGRLGTSWGSSRGRLGTSWGSSRGGLGTSWGSSSGRSGTNLGSSSGSLPSIGTNFGSSWSLWNSQATSRTSGKTGLHTTRTRYTKYAAAVAAGYTIHGMSSYRTRFVGTSQYTSDPTVCYTDNLASFGRPHQTGYFVCPYSGYTADATYCCGPLDQQRCCTKTEKYPFLARTRTSTTAKPKGQDFQTTRSTQNTKNRFTWKPVSQSRTVAPKKNPRLKTDHHAHRDIQSHGSQHYSVISVLVLNLMTVLIFA